MLKGEVRSIGIRGRHLQLDTARRTEKIKYEIHKTHLKFKAWSLNFGGGEGGGIGGQESCFELFDQTRQPRAHARISRTSANLHEANNDEDEEAHELGVREDVLQTGGPSDAPAVHSGDDY